MLVIKVVLEGILLGFLLYLVCAIGIRNGAVGMVHLYDEKVQKRVVELGLASAEEIKKWVFGTVGMAIIAAVLSGFLWR